MLDDNRGQRMMFVSLGLLAIVAVGAALRWAVPSRAAPADSREPACGACGFGPVDVDGGVVGLLLTVPGRVAGVEVKEGALVKEGAVLVRLDGRQAELRVREARASLDAAERQLALAEKAGRQKDLKLAEQQAVIRALHRRHNAARLMRDRLEGRLRRELANPKECQVAREQVREIEAQLDAEEKRLEEIQLRDPALEVGRAAAEVRAARARLGQVEDTREQHVLRAPADGTVLRLLVSAGDLVAPQPGRPAVQFWPANRPLVVRAEIDQDSAGGLAEGDEVRVFDYYSPAGFTGTGRVLRVGKWYAQPRTVLDEPGRFKDTRTLECVIDRLQPARDAAKTCKAPCIGQLMRVEILPGKSW
jgi:multidrug resistance efflux pump